MQAMHIYQILDHCTACREPDPGFKVLDNSGSIDYTLERLLGLIGKQSTCA